MRSVEIKFNPIPVEIIREKVFGGTCLRDIYTSVNEKRYKKSQKEFDQLKILIRSIIHQIFTIQN